MTGSATAFIHTLVEGGIDVFFGVPGVDTLPIYAALAEEGATSIVVRHEATAGYAADAFFRVSGRPAVCLTTGGPGAANTAAATGEAWASSSTFLHVSTAVPASLGERLPPRGLPHYHPRQQQQFDGTAKWTAHCADANVLESLARVSLTKLDEPPYAPVFIKIPLDILEQELDAAAGPGAAATEMAEVADGDGQPSRPRAPVTAAQLDAAADLLGAARTPVIWAGTGALGVADDLTALADALDAPIILSHSAKRRFPMSHPQVVPYPPHEPAVAALLDASDVMLAVGTDLDAMMTRSGRVKLPSSLVHIDIEAAHIGMSYEASMPLVSRAEEIIPELLARTSREAGSKSALRALEARERVWDDQGEGPFAPARRFLEQLDEALPEDAVVVCDMAVAGYWAAGYLSLAPRRQLLYPMGWGTLGSGLPAAVGAAVAAAGRRVVLISGDAGLLYAAGELATIGEHDLPISVVVVDDGGYGMLRFAGPARFGREFDMDLRSPDFPALAASFGIDSREAALDAASVPADLAQVVAASGPSMLTLKGSLEPPRMSRLWE